MYDELIDELRLESVNMHYEKSDCELFAQAADAIEELSQIAAHYEEESKGWWLAACDAKEKIKELQQTVERYRALAAREQQINMDRAAKLPRWISVEERLPEEKGEYMVFLRAGSIQWGNMNIPTGGYSTIAYFYDGKFHKADGYVTHWMPLPEPPKEEKIS